ncbi:hypothetical protein [Streptomyces sp. NBC_00019]
METETGEGGSEGDEDDGLFERARGHAQDRREEVGKSLLRHLPECQARG